MTTKRNVIVTIEHEDIAKLVSKAVKGSAKVISSNITYPVALPAGGGDVSKPSMTIQVEVTESVN